MVARCGEVFDGTLRRVPGCDGDECVILVGREIGYPCRILEDVVCLLLLAARCVDIGYVEYAVGVLVAVDAFGGQGLDVVEDAVLERDGIVECNELVVVVVDAKRVREVDGKDTNPLGSCATVSVRSASWCQRAAKWCDVHMVGDSGRLHRGR